MGAAAVFVTIGGGGSRVWRTPLSLVAMVVTRKAASHAPCFHIQYVLLAPVENRRLVPQN